MLVQQAAYLRGIGDGALGGVPDRPAQGGRRDVERWVVRIATERLAERDLGRERSDDPRHDEPDPHEVADPVGIAAVDAHDHDTD